MLYSPVISILIPTRNRVGMLAEAIRSALAQDYPSFEVIVADNASTDGTADLLGGITDARLRTILRPHDIGMVGNWRSLIHEHARGEWFIILSDDDRLDDRTYLRRASGALADPDVALVHAGGDVLDVRTGERQSLDLVPGRYRGIDVACRRGQGRPQDFTLCNVLFRRSLAIELRSFDDPWNLSCDSELFLRCCLRGDVVVVPGRVSTYRIHGSNLLLRLASDHRFLVSNPSFAMRVARDARFLVPPSDRRRLLKTCVIPVLRHAAIVLVRKFGWPALVEAAARWREECPEAVDLAFDQLRWWRLRLVAGRPVALPVERPSAEDPSPVDILLATHQGETYLEAQLDSLLAQTWPNIRIIVSDDGSTDGTLRILQNYARRYPGKFEVLDNPQRPGGVVSNFNRLASASTAPYVCFCDQDDLWLPDRVAAGVRAIQEVERRHPGLDLPIMAHSDLALIDRDGNLIDPSMWRFQHLDPATASVPARILTQNVVTGCTMTANRAALRQACPVPLEAVMHDWWLAVWCSGRGVVVTLPQAFVQYRQHANNTVGAKRWDRSWILTILLSGRVPFGDVRTSRERTSRQAVALARTGDDPLARLAARYARLADASWPMRRYLIVRHGFWKVGVWRSISWLLRV